MFSLLLSGVGMGAAAGQRGALTALVLGLFHHTDYFDLGPTWAWMASTPVLVVLGVVALVEVLADRYPDSAELVELGAWLPKAVVGFLAAAAATGTLDGDLNALVASGVLGAGAAVATERGRVRARREARALADAGAGGADRTMHHTETLGAAGLATSALFAPLLVLGVLLVIGAVAIVALAASRAAGRIVRGAVGLRTVDDEPSAGR